MVARKLEDSTLWRVSAWERMREASGDSGFARLGQATVLPTTLLAELSRISALSGSGPVLEVVAACIRHRENALLLLRHKELLWPLSVFPTAGLYHVPRPLLPSLAQGAPDLEVLSVEPPGLKPPGHLEWDRIGDDKDYRPIGPLLWALAMHGPHAELLREITGRAAYRVAADFKPPVTAMSGALGPALQRLRREIYPLADVASWPGMTRERAVRLLNAVYLQGGLMVLRTHRAAREGVQAQEGWRSWLRRPR